MSNEIIYDKSHPKNLIVYEIIYLPWVGNDKGLPWKYIGSTIKDLTKYYGTVSSKRWKDFWKNEVKQHPDRFSKRVLFNCIDIEKGALLEIENDIQVELNVVSSNEFFNYSYANSAGCFGIPMPGEKNQMFGVRRSKEWKEQHCIKMKEVSNTPESKKLRSDIQKIVQNRPEIAANKSVKQSSRWKDPTSKLVNSLLILHPLRGVSLYPLEFRSTGEFRQYVLDNNLSGISGICETLDQARTLTLAVRNTQLGGSNRKLIIEYLLNPDNCKIKKPMYKYITDNRSTLDYFVNYLKTCSEQVQRKFCVSLIKEV